MGVPGMDMQLSCIMKHAVSRVFGARSILGIKVRIFWLLSLLKLFFLRQESETLMNQHFLSTWGKQMPVRVNI